MKGKQVTKATAWKWFSLYIRLRDSFEGGVVKCITCDTYKHFREMQAGHYLSQGAYKRIIFDERNCHVQCVACNHFKGGNLLHYTVYMTQRYGADILDQLKITNRINPRGYDFGAIADIYRNKVNELCKAKGIEL